MVAYFKNLEIDMKGIIGKLNTFTSFLIQKKMEDSSQQKSFTGSYLPTLAQLRFAL
jgi:hypothetical protein